MGVGSDDPTGLILDALWYAATMHRDQRRKGTEAAPYINHPIQVAHTLWGHGVRPKLEYSDDE